MKKLTIRTFALLAALSLATCAITFLCIRIALPYAGKSRSQRMLASETEQLVSTLRVTESKTVSRCLPILYGKPAHFFFCLTESISL